MAQLYVVPSCLTSSCLLCNLETPDQTDHWQANGQADILHLKLDHI
jgi:hypothetical protein